MSRKLNFKFHIAFVERQTGIDFRGSEQKAWIYRDNDYL